MNTCGKRGTIRYQMENAFALQSHFAATYLQLVVAVPVLRVVLNVPALLPNTPIRVVKGQLTVHVEHLNVGCWDRVL